MGRSRFKKALMQRAELGTLNSVLCAGNTQGVRREALVEQAAV